MQEDADHTNVDGRRVPGRTPCLTAVLGVTPPRMLLQSSGLDFKPAELEAEYALNVLWLDKSIGLAVDQIFKGVSKQMVCN
jgi:hypothetical protein